MKRQNIKIASNGDIFSGKAIKIEKLEEGEYSFLQGNNIYKSKPQATRQILGIYKVPEQRPQPQMEQRIKLPGNREELLQTINHDREQIQGYFRSLAFKKSQKSESESSTTPTQVIHTQPAPPVRDSYDLFFESACASIKSMPPKLAAEAKSRISQIITEFELRAISEQELQQLQKQKSTRKKARYENDMTACNEQLGSDNESEIVYTFQAYT